MDMTSPPNAAQSAATKETVRKDVEWRRHEKEDGPRSQQSRAGPSEITQSSSTLMGSLDLLRMLTIASFERREDWGRVELQGSQSDVDSLRFPTKLADCSIRVVSIYRGTHVLLMARKEQPSYLAFRLRKQ